MTHNYTLETDDGDIALELEITHFTPDIPANCSGHIDSWTPPENGELEYEIVSARPVATTADIVPEWISEIAFLTIDSDMQEDVDDLINYIYLQSRCLDFEATKSEDKEIIEFLDKQIAEERESAHFDRECERMGI